MPSSLGIGKVWGPHGTADYSLYKAGSAENHATSDDVTLKTALQQAVNAPDSKKEDQGGGVFRFRINYGIGYVVYRVDHKEQKATIFHYHWNYKLDLPLGVE